MNEAARKEFFHLVVEKQTRDCWSWAGAVDQDLRPIFRGDKAYRVMYRLRIGSIPDQWHVHHKCNNSACVNPRHLIALPEEVHRRVHSNPDEAERIYASNQAALERYEAERKAEELREATRLYEERKREYEAEERRCAEQEQSLREWRRQQEIDAYNRRIAQMEEQERQQQLEEERKRVAAWRHNCSMLQAIKIRFGESCNPPDLQKAYDHLKREPHRPRWDWRTCLWSTLMLCFLIPIILVAAQQNAANDVKGVAVLGLLTASAAFPLLAQGRKWLLYNQAMKQWSAQMADLVGHR